MYCYKLWFVLLFFYSGNLFSQNKTFEVQGDNDENLYEYMTYYIDKTPEHSFENAIFQLNNQKFIPFASNNRNLGLNPYPVWFYLEVKNLSKDHRLYWWSFYTHTDTLLVYEKRNELWKPKDTLYSGKSLNDRSPMTRSLTTRIKLLENEKAAYLVKIINRRHTQNSFVSLTPPVHHLIWEKIFYWNVSWFIGTFSVIGLISLLFGIITQTKSFTLFGVYLGVVIPLMLKEELLDVIVSNKFFFQLIQRLHSLPLSVIASAVNYYIIGYIFSKKDLITYRTPILSSINKIVLYIGMLSLLLYAIYMENIHFGQPIFMTLWYLNIVGVFTVFLVTGLKIIFLTHHYKNYFFGMVFLFLLLFINPSGYFLNYSGILNYYEITYPNYFYWFVCVEFLFIGLVLGLRYKKSIEQKHKLELEKQQQEEQFAQQELANQKIQRQQIARDLHDDLGATINAAKLLVTNSYSHDKKLVEIIEIASKDIRRFHQKLSKENNSYELKIKIEDLIERYNELGKTHFSFLFIGNEAIFPHPFKEPVYNMVSEWLTNVLKHANATEATLQILIDSHELQLLAEDNGKGFDLKKINSFKGNGLRNMQERTTELQGKIHISSEKGNTTFIIHIPIIHTDEKN